MLHEPKRLTPSKKCLKFSDGVEEQRKAWLELQAQAALSLGITLEERLEQLKSAVRVPEENAGPLGIDWSIT